MFVKLPGAHTAYLVTVQKHGPECLFHSGTIAENVINALGKSNYSLAPELLSFVDLLLASGAFTPSKLSSPVMCGKINDKECIVGCIQVFLMRSSGLQWMHDTFPVEPEIAAVYKDCQSYMKAFPSAAQIARAEEVGRPLQTMVAWLNNVAGKRKLWSDTAKAFFNSDLDQPLKAAFKEVRSTQWHALCTKK